MTELATLITAFTTLFVIIDPIGLAPLFVAMTRGMEAKRRRAIALRSCLVGASLLTVFTFLGEAVLNFVGISMPAFRIAGGILLFLTALDMLFERRQSRRSDTADEGAQENHDDPSVFPLAIPLIAGPGAIATMILLAGQAQESIDYMLIVGIMLVVVFINYLFFLTSDLLERALGNVGINVVTRILGMLLAALAIQFILDGLSSFGLGT